MGFPYRLGIGQVTPPLIRTSVGLKGSERSTEPKGGEGKVSASWRDGVVPGLRGSS